MSRTDGKAENQHYVPKMLLRRFAVEASAKRAQVHVFDKIDESTYLTNVENVACERGFYDVEFPSLRLKASAEPWLSEIENTARTVFEKLLTTRRLDSLTSEDRAGACVFLAAQFVRGKGFRQNQLQFDADIGKWIQRVTGDSRARIRGWKPMDERRAKFHQVMFLRRSAPKFAMLMALKSWILFETHAARPFWISDNPIVLHNERRFGLKGNIGLAVPGIQIYLPLSPTLLLGLWAFDWQDTILRAGEELEHARARLAARYRRSIEYVPGVDDVFLAGICRETREELMALKAAIQSGTPARCTPDNLIFFNSLQLHWSERRVFSADADFSLAREILEKSPDYRRPPRWTAA